MKKKDDYLEIEEKIRKKTKAREKKKKPKMQTSGKSVFKLKELINKSKP